MQLHKTDAILYLKDSCQLAYRLGSAAHEKPCLTPCNEMPCISASSYVCNMCLHLLKHMARGKKMLISSVSFQEQEKAATMQAHTIYSNTAQ